jgi:predicted nucleic acid-binding protein
LRERFSGRILPVNEETADLWGCLQAAAEARGRPLPTLDCQLAATAMVHGLTLVTRNTDDFATTGVELFDPWA